MKIKQLTFVITLCAIAASLSAQSTNASAKSSNSSPAGILLFVDGDDFSIYRNSVLRSFQANAQVAIGMNIQTDDFIQTGRGTTLEIQMLPGQSVVKVAENTSFRVINDKNTGSTGLEILYGKIRSRVDKQLGSNGYFIQGKTAVAGVRGTDFGYDVVAVPGSANEPTSSIYTYEGTVAVKILEKGSSTPAQDAPSYDVPAGSTLTVADTPDDQSKKNAKTGVDSKSVLSSGDRTVVINKSIPAAVDDYWKKNDFKAKELSDDDVTQIVQSSTDPKAGQATTVNAGTVQLAKQQQKAPPRLTAADLVEPLTVAGALDSIKRPQYYIASDGLKTGGIVTGSIGLAAGVAGLLVYGFGSDVFSGMSSDTKSTLGISLIGGSMVSFITGTVLYVVGASQ